jgi:hypothetical protein
VLEALRRPSFPAAVPVAGTARVPSTRGAQRGGAAQGATAAALQTGLPGYAGDTSAAGVHGAGPQRTPNSRRA